MADTWAFVLAAAGSGNRLGGTPKQFRLLGGRPLWEWSARVADGLYRRGMIAEIVGIFPRGLLPQAPSWLAGPFSAVSGGDTRSESVLNGIEATGADYVLIHDAARPFLSERICRELIEQTAGTRGAAPLLPSVDSLKNLKDGRMLPMSRDGVMRTQTPQAFHREELILALGESESGSTDEASLWLSSGREMAAVSGDERNFKITTEFDWQVAQSFAGGAADRRVGFGFDVHELVPGRDLVLGGLKIDSPLGLLGHSDADIVCHAISDALLGACGLGDIGTLFPAADERYRDADSTALLAEVLGLLDSGGWKAVWVDVTLVAQIPRLGGIIPAIMDNMSRRFGAHSLEGKLSIKVKSGEGVGSVGRGECMNVHAVATVERCLLTGTCEI